MANNQSQKSQKMAEDLRRRGFPHGKRQSKPNPHSGGLANFRDMSVVGSAASRRAQTGANRPKKPSTKGNYRATASVR